MVAKLSVDLPRNVGHKVFFDNWFTTLDLMLYFKKEGLFADLDYRVDVNSGVIIVQWLDNSVIQLCSNFVGIQPMETIERWEKKDKAK